MVDRELEQSKKLLEGLLKAPVVGLAYPYGFCNMKIASIAKKHYKYARSFHASQHFKGSKENLHSKFLLDSVCLGSLHIIASAILRSLRHPEQVNMIILLHNESFFKIFLLLLLVAFLLRPIPHIKMVTVSEAATSLECTNTSPV